MVRDFPGWGGGGGGWSRSGNTAQLKLGLELGKNIRPKNGKGGENTGPSIMNKLQSLQKNEKNSQITKNNNIKKIKKNRTQSIREFELGRNQKLKENRSEQAQLGVPHSRTQV